MAILATVSFDDPASAIDTSDWLTYESPLGFTIKYPPEWVVDESEDPVAPLGTAKIVAQSTLDAIAARELVIEGGTVIAPAGVAIAWFELYPQTFPAEFDAAILFQLCKPDDPPLPDPDTIGQPTQETFAGQPAVRCLSEGPTRDGEHSAAAESIWLASPNGGLVGITGYTLNANADTLALLQAVFATIFFRSTP